MSATRVSKIRRNQTFESHQECAEIINQIEILSTRLLDKVQKMTPKHYLSYAKVNKIFTTTREAKDALDSDIHKLPDDSLPEIYRLKRDDLKHIYYRGLTVSSD